jgi:hypothetical protein
MSQVKSKHPPSTPRHGAAFVDLLLLFGGPVLFVLLVLAACLTARTAF